MGQYCGDVDVAKQPTQYYGTPSEPILPSFTLSKLVLVFLSRGSFPVKPVRCDSYSRSFSLPSILASRSTPPGSTGRHSLSSTFCYILHLSSSVVSLTSRSFSLDCPPVALRYLQLSPPRTRQSSLSFPSIASRRHPSAYLTSLPSHYLASCEAPVSRHITSLLHARFHIARRLLVGST